MSTFVRSCTLGRFRLRRPPQAEAIRMPISSCGRRPAPTVSTGPASNAGRRAARTTCSRCSSHQGIGRPSARHSHLLPCQAARSSASSPARPSTCAVTLPAGPSICRRELVVRITRALVVTGGDAMLLDRPGRHAAYALLSRLGSTDVIGAETCVAHEEYLRAGLSGETRQWHARKGRPAGVTTPRWRSGRRALPRRVCGKRPVVGVHGRRPARRSSRFRRAPSDVHVSPAWAGEMGAWGATCAWRRSSLLLEAKAAYAPGRSTI